MVAWSYFDAAGVPIISNERFHRETVKLDDRGHVTELAYFGPDGASVMRDGGYTRISITYQGDKEASRMYFDTDGKPALMDGLYAERRQEYDRNGNQTLEAYFDVDGKPKPQANDNEQRELRKEYQKQQKAFQRLEEDLNKLCRLLLE